MADLTRRKLMIALPCIGAAVASPVIAAEEQPGDRLDRLMQEISELLDDALMGTFCAVIGPSRDDRPLVSLMPTRDVRKALSLLRSPTPFDLEAWLKSQSPIERANWHQLRLAQALCEASPGRWRTATHDGDHDFLLLIRDAKTTLENASVFVQNLTGGAHD